MRRTRLHRAVFYGKLDEMSQLLEIDCNVNIKDGAGLTALELAQKLQKQFTYPVSLKLFPGNQISIQADNCAAWKIIEDMICEHFNFSKRNVL